MSEPVYIRLPVNLFEVETEGNDTHPAGYRRRVARIGPMIGATALGATVYDLDPGESVCPYHYEAGNEEWLIVLTGTPTLRDEEDEEYELKQWDVVVFPEGPEGAHKITNRSEEPVRIAMFSTKNEPEISTYPDSGKVGIWPEGKIFRIADAVDYYDGET
jgi:uncharacterized cupin superfamily protein